MISCSMDTCYVFGRWQNRLAVIVHCNALCVLYKQIINDSPQADIENEYSDDLQPTVAFQVQVDDKS